MNLKLKIRMDKEQVTVFVVGASGPTGRHLVEQLLIKNHQIKV